VLTGAEVTRILFKPKTDLEDSKVPRLAKAVKFVLGGQKYKVRVKREVIITAGMSSFILG